MVFFFKKPLKQQARASARAQYLYSKQNTANPLTWIPPPFVPSADNPSQPN